MKKILISLFVFLIEILCAVNAFAQNPFIDSVKIFPENPTREDTVRIALYVWTSSPGEVLYLNHQTTPGHIDIKGCYSLNSGSTVPEFYNDTLIIGKLHDTTYKIDFTAYWSWGSTCTYDDSNKRSLKLNVLPPTSIKPIVTTEWLNVYPNPAKNILNINSLMQIKNLCIYNIYGKPLKTLTLKQSNYDISFLPPGIYLLHIESDKGKYIKRFLKE